MSERKDGLIKIRNCMVTQFFEYYDTQDINEIVSRVKSLTNVKKFAVAIHDKDKLDNGEPKKIHFHAVITFNNATTIGAVAKGLHVNTEYVEKIRATPKSAYLYLVHRNHKEKFPYNPESVVANFDYVEYVDGVKPKINLSEIAERIASGEIKQYNLTQYLSCEDYAKHKPFIDRCFIYRQQLMKTLDRHLNCVFISGASHTGKTTFAKQMATSLGYHCFVSSGGKNPLDDYKGEECIILDDLRDDVYSFTDILKLTDNNTESLIGCRFYNKSIAECKLIIVTSVTPIEKFYYWETDGEETQIQLFRRFKTWLVMEKDTVTEYNFNENLDKYVMKIAYVNPIALQYDPEVSNNFMTGLKEVMKLEVAEKHEENLENNQ